MAFMLVFAACKKDEDEDPDKLNPTADVKGLVIEWTSITCGICGSTGGPLLTQYATDGPNGAMIALHVNSSDAMKIENDVYFAFAEDRPSGGGIPSFWVGDTKTTTQDVNAVKDQVKQNAVAGIDMKYDIEGSTMTVETLTKFFSQADGDYHLSVYLLENGIDGSSNAPTGYVQAGTTNSYPNDDYKHNFVYRKAASNVMGELIVSNPAADKEVSKTYTISIDAEWNDVFPVAVLWKHDPNATIKYSYVNSFRL